MTDTLASWRDGAAKSAICDFVARVTTAGGAGFVPPAARIATFDNDGTLWLEKPMYIQLQHGLRAIGKLAAAHPELRERQPFKAVSEHDMAWFAKVQADYAAGDSERPHHARLGHDRSLRGPDGRGVRSRCARVPDAPRATRASTSPTGSWSTSRWSSCSTTCATTAFRSSSPRGAGATSCAPSARRSTACRARRPSAAASRSATPKTRTGVAQVMRTKEIEQPVDDGPGKPLHIHRATGRRPILAGGNSDGDIHMLRYAAGHSGPSLGLLVHHDDAEREYAYDGGAEKALRLAAQRGLGRGQHEGRLEDRLGLAAARPGVASTRSARRARRHAGPHASCRSQAGAGQAGHCPACLLLT